MKTGFQPVAYYTATQVTAGDANNLPGVRIIIVDSAGSATGVVMEGTATTPAVTQTSANSPLNNFSATTDPSSTEDINQGYQVGSRWVNIVTTEGFICLDATAGAAVWELSTANVIADIPGLQPTLNAKQDTSQKGAIGGYAGLDSSARVQAANAPIKATYSTGGDQALAPSNIGAASASHSHPQSDVTNLVSDLAVKAPLTSPVLTGTPTAPTPTPGDNTTKLATTAFVLDAVTSSQAGLDWKQSVRIATTANITLSGIQTIDGTAVVAGNRVLVKDQTTASQNGIYDVAAGAWTRSADANANNEVNAGMTVYVEEGTILSTSVWTLVTPGNINLGTTGLTFSRLFNTSGLQPTSEKNAPNGYAGLDANSRIPVAQLANGDVNLTSAETLITGLSRNGLPVYARTITGTSPASATDLNLFTPSTGTASRLINYDGWIIRSGSGQRQPLLTVIPDNTFGHASPVYQDSATGLIKMYIVNSSYNNQQFDITVYYTK